MAADHSTDRDAFGHWLSGFVDGEGCFSLGISERCKKYRFAFVRFDIQLRVDDRPILEEIRDFWGVGHISEHQERGPSKRKANFRVTRARELRDAVIPHFDRYPLRAKKRRDFAIWREAAELYCRVRGKEGTRPKWSPADFGRFEALVIALRQQRAFDAALVPVPAAPEAEADQLCLFA